MSALNRLCARCLFLLLAASLLPAQSFAPRANFGALLEPQGGLLHGAGQDPASFANYWGIMPDGRQPTVVIAAYLKMNAVDPTWADAIKAQIAQYGDRFVIPQVAIDFGTGPDAHYEQDVADGLYDAQIDNLIAGLLRLAAPVYLRIGNEYNGSWNGYLPTAFQNAFIRVAGKLRAQPSLEVAIVWNGNIDGATDWMDYYPGDDYVDWFGMNIFNTADFQHSALPAFFALARAHRKPVMMGETTPVYVGAQSGATSWNGWYQQFFHYLQTTPELKQFNYINWDWLYFSQFLNGQYADWGDARLETDAAAYVRNLYIAQLADPVFVHATTESAFRQQLGFNDTTPPPAVADLGGAPVAAGSQLAWTPLTDPSGIARYYVYRDNVFMDFSLGPPYTDNSSGALGIHDYSLAAMDRAGNLGPQSAAATVATTTIEKMSNGGFEVGLNYWLSRNYSPSGSPPAQGAVTPDPNNAIDGSASVRLDVAYSTGTNWHLQLQQLFPVTAGLTYTIRLQARANAPASLPVVIQETGGQATIYSYNVAAIPAGAASFQYSFVAPDTQPASMSFYYGNLTTSVWLDDISVVESMGTTASAHSDPR